MSFDDAMELVVHGFEIGGVAILVIGSLAAVVQALWSYRATGTRQAYESARRNVGRAILLGLEFLIIAHIVLTITVDLDPRERPRPGPHRPGPHVPQPLPRGRAGRHPAVAQGRGRAGPAAAAG